MNLKMFFNPDVNVFSLDLCASWLDVNPDYEPDLPIYEEEQNLDLEDEKIEADVYDHI